MSSRTLDRFLSQLRHIHGVAEASDAQLLDRFANRREEQAFAALVRRYGPLVLGVCRRVLRDEHESEDAFQAVFMALARQAGSIRRSECLSSWFYSVALRVALRARVAVARRRRHEQNGDFHRGKPLGPDQALALDLRLVLDEELGRLPAQYRRALILCYLHGKTHVEAARELGCPPGSMSRHLARAKELLRARLVRRGVAPTALLGAEFASLPAQGAMPPTLVFNTVYICTTVTICSGASAVVYPKLLALADGGLKSMFVANLKMTAMVVFAILAFGAGAGALWHRARTDDPAPATVVNTDGPETPSPRPRTKSVPKPPVSHETAPPAADIHPPDWERRLIELRDKLDTPVTVEFGDFTPFDDAMSFLMQRYDLPIVVLPGAFKDEADLADFKKQPARLQKVTGMRLRNALGLLLEPIKADYQLRDAGLFIFPKEYAASGRLLQQPVAASFHQVSLVEALARLAAQTGVSVVLDARAAQDAKIAITADLDNVPLENAVRILADMAALKPVALGSNTFYVTTVANARALEAERAATPPPHLASGAKKAKEDAAKSGNSQK
jgi:RNA polymerase sigma factor (sigma-70 family)